VGHSTPVDHVSAGRMELRPRSGVSGLPVKPRATSLDRKPVGMNRINQADNANNETLANSPSSATGVTRDGKETSRILPAEGGRIRTSSPQPRSESAGGADRSPEGDPTPRRGQTWESGDAGGRATPDRQALAVAAISGKHTRRPDKGAEVTLVPEVESLTRCSDTSSQTRLDVSLLITMPVSQQCHLPVPTFRHGMWRRIPI